MSSFGQFKKQFKKNQERAEKEKKERQAVLSLEKRSSQFAERKSEYLEGAKKALKDGDNSAYERYISLIKNVMFQKAQIDDMLVNYKMARDLRDMGKAREGFSETLDVIMSDVLKLSEKVNLKKTEKNFAKGVYANATAAENLQHLLEMNGASFSTYANKVSDVSENDLKFIIESEINKDNADIDARMSEFEAELMGESEKPSDKIAMGGPSSARDIPTSFGGAPSQPAQAPYTSAPEIPEVPVPEVPAAPVPNRAAPVMPDPAPAADEPRGEKPSPESKVLENDDEINEDFKFDWDSLPTIKFDDIAGLESVKQMVRVKVILPLTQPNLFEGYVKKNGGGMLLYGPPGTGKTMIAAAIANEIGAKFCSVKPSDLLHQGAGNTEKAVRSLFSQARSFPCAVIYFDEMDSITPKSTKSQYAKQLRSELLSQLQGIESYGKDTGNILFLIAATNKPWEIDSAFIRPGRFGTRVYVGLPDDPARRYMIEHRLNKVKGKGIVKVADDIDLDSIVERTNGFNGSDLTNLTDRVEEISMLRSITTGEKSILNADFDTAFESVSSTVQREDIEKLLEWKKANE